MRVPDFIAISTMRRSAYFTRVFALRDVVFHGSSRRSWSVSLARSNWSLEPMRPGTGWLGRRGLTFFDERFFLVPVFGMLVLLVKQNIIARSRSHQSLNLHEIRPARGLFQKCDP